jgi:hypothetical protein
MARGVVRLTGDPVAEPGKRWGIEVRSDFEDICPVRRQDPAAVPEVFDCPHMGEVIATALTPRG